MSDSLPPSPSVAGFSTRLAQFAGFTWRARTGFVVVVATAFLVSLVGILLAVEGGQMPPWWTWFEPVINLTTLAVAMVVWVAETRREWEAQLPKCLTVHFVWEGFVVLQCHRAYLADTGDIRAWAQQLGRQMTNGDIRFEPFVTQADLPIDQDAQSRLCKPYAAQFTLTERPAVLCHAPGHASLNPCLVWLESSSEPGRKEVRWLSNVKWEGFPKS